MQSVLISPPHRIPILLQIGIWISERITGRQMLPARILAWYPKAAIGSGALEALVAHHERDMDERLLKIVRIQASFAVNCAFCIDMNSYQYETLLSQEEITALKGLTPLEAVPSFSKRERMAIQYSRLVSGTPLSFPPAFFEELKQSFREREIVILASTAAQVNYWARLIQALGIPPAGFTDRCDVPSSQD